MVLSLLFTTLDRADWRQRYRPTTLRLDPFAMRSGVPSSDS
jgi:hypothetical protein